MDAVKRTGRRGREVSDGLARGDGVMMVCARGRARQYHREEEGSPGGRTLAGSSQEHSLQRPGTRCHQSQSQSPSGSAVWR